MAIRHVAFLALCFLVVHIVSPVASHAGHPHGHGDAGHFHDHHHDHDHDHDHAHAEPASFKYSKQANQDQQVRTPPRGQAHYHEHTERTAKVPAGAPSRQAHDHGHGHMHAHGPSAHSHSAHGHAHTHNRLPQRPKVVAPYSAWVNALFSTLAISLAPFLILFFIPIEANDAASQPLLRVFLAFASGSLLGDAFLHLIPHAVPGHSHSHSHIEVDHHHGHTHVHEEKEEVHDHLGHTIVGLWVLGGIISFLVVEKVIRHVKGSEGHSHGHSHGPSKQGKIVQKKKVEQINRKSSGEESQKKSSEEEDYEVVRERKHAAGDPDVKESMHVTEETTVVRDAKDKFEGEDEEHDKEVMVTSSGSNDIKVGGYLNFAADFAHNFTDGLAIGASFLSGQNIGWITTFTILFHEIPHEIGDFALLVQSGCSKKKAMLLQLVTAVGAFLGCLVSLIFGVSDTEDKTSPILAFTAGGFIYIATVSVIPELLMESKIKQSLMEIAALLLGIAMMVVIAIYE